MSNDFGFVQLDLSDVYPRDQGIYTCRAWNQVGEAFTTTTITCKGKFHHQHHHQSRPHTTVTGTGTGKSEENITSSPLFLSPLQPSPDTNSIANPRTVTATVNLSLV